MNKNKIDINAEKKLYYNLNNKLASRIKKNDKYNDVLADISQNVGFDTFKLSTKVFGSSFRKYEHLILKMDKTKSIGEKNKIIESLLMGIDRDFADIGGISAKGFSKSFKKIFYLKFRTCHTLTVTKSIEFMIKRLAWID